MGQAESVRGDEPGTWFWIEYLNPLRGPASQMQRSRRNGVMLALVLEQRIVKYIVTAHRGSKPDADPF